MIQGILLGTITWLSFVTSWLHFPRFIKNITKRWIVLTDIMATGVAYILLTSISKSLIAVIGAMVTGLLVNFTILGYLWGTKHGHINPPNDSKEERLPTK